MPSSIVLILVLVLCITEVVKFGLVSSKGVDYQPVHLRNLIGDVVHGSHVGNKFVISGFHIRNLDSDRPLQLISLCDLSEREA